MWTWATGALDPGRPNYWLRLCRVNQNPQPTSQHFASPPLSCNARPAADILPGARLLTPAPAPAASEPVPPASVGVLGAARRHQSTAQALAALRAEPRLGRGKFSSHRSGRVIACSWLICEQAQALARAARRAVRPGLVRRCARADAAAHRVTTVFLCELQIRNSQLLLLGRLGAAAWRHAPSVRRRHVDKRWLRLRLRLRFRLRFRQLRLRVGIGGVRV